jgi:hypothetical protein
LAEGYSAEGCLFHFLNKPNWNPIVQQAFAVDFEEQARQGLTSVVEFQA